MSLEHMQPQTVRPGASGQKRAWQDVTAGLRQLRDDWAIFSRNRLAMLGLALIGVFALMAIIHPLLMGTIWPKGIYNPETGYDINVAPWPAPPGQGHLLGTDALGRDVLSMLLASTRASFTVAITAALTTALVSLAIGAVSAYYRGAVDAVFSNISDALLLLPAPIIMVILSSKYYEAIGTVRFGLLYGVLAGAGSAAIVMRSHALTLMTRPFIDAARVAGARGRYIILRHLVPHMLPLVAVHMMLTVTGAVVADGFIAFFGLRGVRLNWGSMIYNGIAFQVINPTVPWNTIVAPTLALSLFAAAFYFVARGLHDVSDPRTRGRQR